MKNVFCKQGSLLDMPPVEKKTPPLPDVKKHMSKLERLIEELCPNGVEYKEIHEIFETKNGYTPSKSDSSNYENGTIPWFRMEDIRLNGGILSDSLEHITPKAVKGNVFPANSIIIATSATIGVHALITVESISNQRFTYLITKDNYTNLLIPKFLYYLCFKLDKWCLDNINISSFASVDMKKFNKYKIPVPPLPVQEEIVRILDTFSELTAELTAELTKRKQQYQYYRNNLIDFLENRAKKSKKLEELIAKLCPNGVEYKRLAEICGTITTGRLNANAMVENGKYPFFTCDKNPYRIDSYAFDTTAIIISGNGSQIGHLNYYSGKFNAYQRTYVIYNFKNVYYLYLFHYLKSYLRIHIIKYAKKGSVPYITMPMLENFYIPVPPLPVQEEIVAILNRFDALCNDLTSGLPAEIEARKKQYEYYRDKLLTFKEAV